MNNAQFEQTLDQYVDKLMQQRDLDKLPDDKKTNLREKIKETIVDAFNTQVLRGLPEDKLTEFNKALDEDKSIDELGEIVKSAGLDTDAILKQVLDATRDAFYNVDINKAAEPAGEEA